MRYQIAPHAHYCVASDHVVFLDLRADRYFALPPSTASAFLRALQGEQLGPTDHAALSPLLVRGLISPSACDQDSRSPAVTETPLSELAPFTPARINLANLGTALLAHAQASVELKAFKLGKTIDRIAKQKVRILSRRGATPDLDPAVLSAFLTTRRLVPSQNQCLRWSIAAIHYLSHHQQFPQLVLGVRMRPFHAHAWVQEGSMVLNDTVDFVSLYTPILVT